MQPKGHLFVTLSDAEFQTETGEARLVPVQPPLNPVIPLAATQFQILQANRDHDQSCEDYNRYLITSEALIKMITTNVDKSFLTGIQIDEVTVLEAIEYLKQKYYKISNKQIEKNDAEMRAPWDIETPIEAYFLKVKECKDMAIDAEEPFTDRQLVQIMLSQMEKVVDFKEEIKRWKRKTDAEKTIENFEAHFTEAYEDLLEEMENAAEEVEEANSVIT